MRIVSGGAISEAVQDGRAHLAAPQEELPNNFVASNEDIQNFEVSSLLLDNYCCYHQSIVSYIVLAQGNTTQLTSETEHIMNRPTELAGESSRKPPAYHGTKDWRPVFEEKMQGMLYYLGASKAFTRNSNAVGMGEACDDGVMGSQDTNNTAHVEECDYTQAMSPDANFDGPSVEEARKQRIKALQHRIEEIDSVAQDHNETSSRPLEESKEKCLNELALLSDYVAPRRATALRTTETVNPVEHLPQSADPTPLLRTTEETHPDSPRSDSPHAVAPITAASVQAVLRECSPRPDGRGTGDSDASTVRSASNAAIWRCQSKYDDSAEEEEQQEESRGKGAPLDSVGTLTELEGFFNTPGPETSERRDSALAGLEAKQRGEAGGKGEAKSPAADRESGTSGVVDSLPVPDGGRRHPIKENPKQKTTQRQCEHEEPASESAVQEPARYTRPPTAAQKGKWAAECECPICQPQRHDKQVRFDEPAMDKAEEGPGLSHEGFVKAMRENRRRMEADERGEGASSWATSGPAGLGLMLVGLEDMFSDPRPAPPVPVRGQESIISVMQGERAQKRRVNMLDIGQPMELNGTIPPVGRYGVFPRVHEFGSRPGPRTRGRVPFLGEADPMAQMDGSSPHALWRALSRRLRK